MNKKNYISVGLGLLSGILAFFTGFTLTQIAFVYCVAVAVYFAPTKVKESDKEATQLLME